MGKREQRYWEDVVEGEELTPFRFPLTVYRLVMEAGANRDFNSIHHNTEYARQTGAANMYANNIFLQGMWEKMIRHYIGLAGTIKSLKGFRMNMFNTVGDTVTAKGKVKRKWLENDIGYVELEVWSENAQGISVGPGFVTVTVPTK